MAQAGTKSSAVRGVQRRLRRRGGLALSLSLLVLAVLLPVGVIAQTPAGPSYSGVAEGDVAEVLLAPDPDAPAALDATIGETTGAVNSAANIIPDSPGSPENEAEDFSVGTATPLRLSTGGDPLLQPFSVQSSAPADAGGSNALIDINEESITLRVLRAETQSQAAVDASTAATQNDVDIANAVIQDLVTLPAGRTNADVNRTADGAITAFADSNLDSPTVVLGQLAEITEGVVAANAINAASTSTANGTTSANEIDFRITDLTIAGLLTINAGPAEGNPGCVTVDVALGGPEGGLTPELNDLLAPLTELLAAEEDGVLRLTLPRGVNLLDPSTFDDNEACTQEGGLNLGELIVSLGPILEPLTGEDGLLEGTALIIGGGFSEQGDGTFARGLVEALRINVGLGDEPVASVVLGRAFTAVNATQANAVPFEPVDEATPAETIFTNPVPQPPPEEPPPEEPPPEEPPDEEPEEEPEAEPEAEPNPPADDGDEELPFTGLAIAGSVVAGCLLLLGGSALRTALGRRGEDLPTEE